MGADDEFEVGEGFGAETAVEDGWGGDEDGRGR